MAVGRFVLEQTRPLPDYDGAIAHIYFHEVHKCPFLMIHAPDDNHNHLGLIVRTPTIDDSGANHMLEHMVLMRSEHYPGSDVFQELAERAFATDANAATSPVCTTFEYSTTNFKDISSSTLH
jgi:Zn-dependent M16 (insulinase) family peptidase